MNNMKDVLKFIKKNYLYILGGLLLLYLLKTSRENFKLYLPDNEFNDLTKRLIVNLKLDIDKATTLKVLIGILSVGEINSINEDKRVKHLTDEQMKKLRDYIEQFK